MKILFLCTAYNSLSQRLALVLKSHGHAVTVELALSPEVMISAAELAAPDIIVCPFLTKRVPPEVYTRWLTLIVHPGPPGDVGPSALDWTLFGDKGEHESADEELRMIDAAYEHSTGQRGIRSHWGVTVLQAIEAFDAGPVWAFDQFKLENTTRTITKSDLYRGPVTRAATKAVLAAIEIIQIVARQDGTTPTYSPHLCAPDFAKLYCVSKGLPFQGGNTVDRPLLKATSRDFHRPERKSERLLKAADIIQRIACGDSQPGILTSILGTPLFVYNAYIQKDPLPQPLMVRASQGGPGTILATREGAVLVEVGADCPIWIGHLRRPKAKSDKYLHPKLPATMALMSIPGCAERLGLLDEVQEWSLTTTHDESAPGPWRYKPGTYQQVWVELEEYGPDESKIGYVHSEFYNGAFSTSQCEMLLKAIQWTLTQPGLKAIVMLGGTGYFSNGIALNVIEGSADPSAEGWANINAIDDCVQALLAPAGVVTFAAIRGNAAAGGLALATAADVVLCAESAVLNPHYRGIGLYGSEWHTYSWYERCGAGVAARFARDMLPMSANEARQLGLIDLVIDNDKLNADGLLLEVKAAVRKVMIAKMGDAIDHIGATWTKPLRPVVTEPRLPLSEYMLRNKAKFLAYTFTGNGQDHLSINEHFQKYRKYELDQMTLDLFHPHRNKRFSKRCTAFVRKLVPTSTPMRFALHRRSEVGKWQQINAAVLHQDEEDMDIFDGLDIFPASAAIPRLPKGRPECIIRLPVAPREILAVDTPLANKIAEDNPIISRQETVTDTATESPLSPSSSTSENSPAFTDPPTPVSDGSDAGKVFKVKDEDTFATMPSFEALESKLLVPAGIPASPEEPNVSEKSLQQELPILWSCYYSANDDTTADAARHLDHTSEALENIIPTS